MVSFLRLNSCYFEVKGLSFSKTSSNECAESTELGVNTTTH